MSITIHDVAEKANVSVSTASRVLNGGTKGMRRDAVERAEKVLQAARELGFSPNPSARKLVMKRTFTIGFIGTELDNPVRGRFIEALRVAAKEQGYNLLVSGIRQDSDARQILDSMFEQRVEGLILGNVQHIMHKIYRDLPEELSKNIQWAGFGEGTDLPWDSVVINYSGMIDALVSHLIQEHRAKHIVYAAANHTYSRSLAYQHRMREEGLESNICLWQADNHSLAAGKKLAMDMIAADSRPEAIVCHNDVLACGIIAGLRQAKVRVPEDIAVVGLDNIEMAAYLNPALTTVGVDATKLAQALFKLLHERITGEFSGSPRQLHCPEVLYVRESCGCTNESEQTLNSTK